MVIPPAAGLRALVALAGLLCHAAAAAERCEPSAVGARDRATLDRFVLAVRDALRAPGADAFAALVRYPLSVNSRDLAYGKLRTFVVHDPGELRRHAGAVLSKALREAVLSAPPDDVACAGRDLAIGARTVWATADAKGALRVTAVMSPGFRWPEFTYVEQMVCETAEHAIVVDEPRPGTLRYRSWRKGRPRDAAPDLMIEGGQEGVVGTGPCAHSVWRFARGAFEYVVAQEGCTNGTGPPDRVGYLTVERKGETKLERDCFGR